MEGRGGGQVKGGEEATAAAQTQLMDLARTGEFGGLAMEDCVLKYIADRHGVFSRQGYVNHETSKEQI